MRLSHYTWSMERNGMLDRSECLVALQKLNCLFNDKTDNIECKLNKPYDHKTKCLESEVIPIGTS